MTSIERRNAIRKRLLDEKIGRGLAADTADDNFVYFCRFHPGNKNSEGHYFFVVGRVSFRHEDVGDSDMRSFWIGKDGSVFAVSKPHGVDVPKEYLYYRNVLGNEQEACDLLDTHIFAFADAPEYVPPSGLTFAKRFANLPNHGRSR